MSLEIMGLWDYGIMGLWDRHELMRSGQDSLCFHQPLINLGQVGESPKYGISTYQLLVVLSLVNIASIYIYIYVYIPY